MVNLEQHNYVDWDVKPVLKLLDKGNYAFRVVLKFRDGTQQIQQKSGFRTKKEAENARKRTMGELSNGTYVVNSKLKVSDFLEYWLENDIRQRVRSYNTYFSYSQTVKRHIIPYIGRKRLAEVDRGDIQRLFKNRAEYSVSVVRQVKTVLNVAFRYAVVHKLMSLNPAEGIALPKNVGVKSYHARNIDTQKTLTMEQVQVLLEASKETPIHMQVLFNALMGLRRQEINGLKYSDVDYINRTLSVERQLGKGLSRNAEADIGTMTQKELPLKTSSSKRVLPIPDYVFEAILEERKAYERNRNRYGSKFFDAGYICCSSYGKPRSKDFHWKYYKNLLRSNGLPDIRWHDLRSSYCTMLLKNDFSAAAVARLLGHAKELVTVDVYGDNRNIIPEEIPELEAYMEEVMPKGRGGHGPLAELQDVVIEVDEYLKA